MTSSPYRATRPRVARRGRLTPVDITGFVLVLASFSWTTVGIGEYARSGVGSVQLATRVGPLCVVAAYLLWRDLNRRLRAVRQLHRWPMNLLVWYALVSGAAGILTSDLPLLAAWKSCEVLVVAYWASHALLLHRRGRGVTLERLVKVVIAIMVFTLAMALVNPAAGFRHGAGVPLWLQGYFPPLNPNTVGVMSTVGLYALLSRGTRFTYRAFNRFSVVALLITLLLAQSRTAYLCVFVLTLLVFVEQLYHRADTARLLRVALLLFAGALGLFFLESLVQLFVRQQSAETLITLSGRVDFWRVAIDSIKERTWFGGGMATGSRYLYVMDPELFRQGRVNLHNAFLELVVGGGVVGGLPLALGYLAAAGRALRDLFLRAGHHLGFAGGLAIILVVRATTSIGPALFSIELMIFPLVMYRLKHRPMGRARPTSATP